MIRPATRVTVGVWAVLILGVAFAGPSATASAAALPSPVTQMAVCGSGWIGNLFGFQPWYSCLPTADDGTPQLKSISDIYLIAFVVVDWIIKAAAYVAAGMIFYMLFKIAMARGNVSQYSTAISGIRDAIIGLVIAMLSVAILNFISGAF